MRFEDCEMRPGKVLKVVDNYGTIKASCAGIFSDQDDVEKLPPVFQAPFIKASRHYFAAPQPDDLIWVIVNWQNPQELFYCFRDDINDNSNELDKGPQDIEVAMKRTDPNDRNATIFEVSYDTDNGYKIINGGDNASSFGIDNTQDHNIHLEHSSGIGVHVEKNAICLGSAGGAKYKAVCGEPLINALKSIRQALSSIMDVSSTPALAPLKGALTPCITQIDMAIAENKLLSNKVTLDK